MPTTWKAACVIFIELIIFWVSIRLLLIDRFSLLFFLLFDELSSFFSGS